MFNENRYKYTIIHGFSTVDKTNILQKVKRILVEYKTNKSTIICSHQQQVLTKLLIYINPQIYAEMKY